MHVDLRAGVWSRPDLRVTELPQWEVDTVPMVWEDIETARIALTSMMLTSVMELPRSLTGCETSRPYSVQLVASWTVERHTPFPSRTTELTWHRHIWSSGPGMRMRRQAASGWQKSLTDPSLVFPIQRTPYEEAACWWPTLSVGTRVTERRPICCAILILKGELALAWCPSGRKTWGDESLGGSVWTDPFIARQYIRMRVWLRNGKHLVHRRGCVHDQWPVFHSTWCNFAWEALPEVPRQLLSTVSNGDSRNLE